MNELINFYYTCSECRVRGILLCLDVCGRGRRCLVPRTEPGRRTWNLRTDRERARAEHALTVENGKEERAWRRLGLVDQRIPRSRAPFRPLWLSGMAPAAGVLVWCGAVRYMSLSGLLLSIRSGVIYLSSCLINDSIGFGAANNRVHALFSINDQSFGFSSRL